MRLPIKQVGFNLVEDGGRVVADMSKNVLWSTDAPFLLKLINSHVENAEVKAIYKEEKKVEKAEKAKEAKEAKEVKGTPIYKEGKEGKVVRVRRVRKGK